ncbi:MAG: helix-hairpin-helix domain-containing protein [Haloarculaceae archaeon]
MSDKETADQTPVEREGESVAKDTAETEAAAGEEVTILDGIGPAYSERLEAVGIESVADLADADAAEIAAETDLGENRVAGWIEQAKEW